MSMTTRNFGNQNEQRAEPVAGTPDQPVAAFAPDVVVQTQDATLANLKPADSTWSHCDKPNDYKNTQEG
jgi:hypothetical protein